MHPSKVKPGTLGLGPFQQTPSSHLHLQTPSPPPLLLFFPFYYYQSVWLMKQANGLSMQQIKICMNWLWNQLPPKQLKHCPDPWFSALCPTSRELNFPSCSSEQEWVHVGLSHPTELPLTDKCVRSHHFFPAPTFITGWGAQDPPSSGPYFSPLGNFLIRSSVTEIIFKTCF